MAEQMTSSTALFDESMQAFRKSLSAKEQHAFQQFKDPGVMMKQMRIEFAQHPQRGRLWACAAKIDSFSRAFSPFFEVINIFAQVKPDWFGVIWGSIRLIFQLGSNYITFFEKVADMFERLSFALPQYQRHIDRCRERRQSLAPERLVKLMSLLYTDIIQFCKEVFFIFARGRKGTGTAIFQDCFASRMGFFGDIIWRPFDGRFSQLLDRMNVHKEMFDRELYSEDQAALTEHIITFQAHLDAAKNLDRQAKIKAQAKEERLATAKIIEIKKWTGAGDYRTIYEHSERVHFQNTGDWFLELGQYRAWRDAQFDANFSRDERSREKTWSDRVLSLQAKPGYGKTILSCSIIEDLLYNTSELVGPSDYAPTTAFYHFDANEPSKIRASEAFRAITAQLIHSHREQTITIDALTMLIDKVGSGQLKASDEDIEQVLRLLLRQFPTYLVFDGIDECIDHGTFLSKLCEICQTSDTRALLLSRPNLVFPLRYRLGRNWAVHLSMTHNSPDIRLFLADAFLTLTDEGLFGQLPLAEASLDEVMQRADGMFLWARLLVNFLESPALTPQERHTTISEINLLEGIERLYSGILSTLTKAFPKERQVAANIFKWVFAALYPPTVVLLHTALAVTPGHGMTDSGYIPDFENSIPRLTCSLVEVRKSKRVGFIHTSFNEFIGSELSASYTEFSLCDRQATHMFLAIHCVSYLGFDIPKEPLQVVQKKLLRALSAAQDPEDDATRETRGIESRRTEESDPQNVTRMRRLLQQRYPLLRYASVAWAEHMYRALQEPGDGNTDKDGNASHAEHLERSQVISTPTWAPILSYFLIDQISVTVWVEACWTFAFKPNLDQVFHQMAPLKQRVRPDSPESRELLWVIRGLNQLMEAVRELCSKYDHILIARPRMIWHHDISSATDPEYWPVWSDDPVKIKPSTDEASLVPTGFVMNQSVDSVWQSRSSASRIQAHIS